jgi:tRNA threonylcarbamoyladenosine biosynthesis protein TsaE
MEVFTKSATETAKFGQKIANNLKGGEVLCLYGGLGSGKTTFIQGLAESLGVRKRVLSPTFIIMREYQIRGRKRKVERFYHIDLYRIKNKEDVEVLGLEEIWSNPENIVAIEWAEKIKEILPKKRIDIYFEYVSENQRKISLSSH